MTPQVLQNTLLRVMMDQHAAGQHVVPSRNVDLFGKVVEMNNKEKKSLKLCVCREKKNRAF